MVRSWMLRTEAHVFVQVKGGYLAEIQSLIPVHPDEFTVQPQGRTPCCQPKHCVRLASYNRRNFFRSL